MLGAVDQGLRGDEAHDLASHHRDSVARGLGLHRLEDPEEGGPLEVGHVDRDLGQVALLKHHSHRLHEAVAAAAVADGLGDALRHFEVRGAQVDVVGDERHARADDAGSRRRVGSRGAEVRGPLRVAHLLGQPLELPPADVLEVAAMRRGRRLLVQEDGDAESLRDRLTHLPGQGDAVGHGRSLDRDEGHDVHRSQTRVLAPMSPEVDPREGHREQLGDRRTKGRLVAGQGQHAPVVVTIGLDVEDAKAGGALQGGHRFIHDLRPAAVADVGNAFDDPGHGPYYHIGPVGDEPAQRNLESARAFPDNGRDTEDRRNR